MNISNIRVRATEEDILSIVKEFLHIEGLSIENITIGEFIKIKGSYTKIIKIKFEATIGLGSIENNILKLLVLKSKVFGISIWSRLQNLVIKKLMKKLKDIGIKFENNVLYVDFTSICDNIKFIDFKIGSVMVVPGGLEVDIDKLSYSEKKRAMSLNELKKIVQATSEEEVNIEGEGKTQEAKTQDAYSKVSTNIRDKIRGQFTKIVKAMGKLWGRFSKNCQENSKGKLEKTNNIAAISTDLIMLVPDIIALLYRLMKDKRIKPKTKVLIGAALIYLAMPIDVIPDSIPILGAADDVGIGFMILDKIIEDIPENIILEHWQGKDNIILKIKEIKDALFSTLGRRNAIALINGSIISLKKRNKKIRN